MPGYERQGIPEEKLTQKIPTSPAASSEGDDTSEL
jgi:hypothetical protein